jgi:DMSO/TMAO reductase YedYZ molybdopterin-dependent catalytic subunit
MKAGRGREALQILLKECGVKGAASWFVAEGSEEVKGASSIPLAKAMDDCLAAYGMNGEALRPQQGFPLRLMVPGCSFSHMSMTRLTCLPVREVCFGISGTFAIAGGAGG